MTAVLMILLTAALVIATKLFFDWTNKYGDEWNWTKIKEGYTKGWPTLLIFTLLICAAIDVIKSNNIYLNDDLNKGLSQFVNLIFKRNLLRIYIYSMISKDIVNTKSIKTSVIADWK